MLNGSQHIRRFLEFQVYNFSVIIHAARVLFVDRVTHYAKEKLNVSLAN